MHVLPLIGRKLLLQYHHRTRGKKNLVKEQIAETSTSATSAAKYSASSDSEEELMTSIQGKLGELLS